MSILGFLDFLHGHSLGVLFTVLIATAGAWVFAEWEGF
jgi:hypothetical protein